METSSGTRKRLALTLLPLYGPYFVLLLCGIVVQRVLSQRGFFDNSILPLTILFGVPFLLASLFSFGIGLFIPSGLSSKKTIVKIVFSALAISILFALIVFSPPCYSGPAECLGFGTMIVITVGIIAIFGFSLIELCSWWGGKLGRRLKKYGK